MNGLGRAVAVVSIGGVIASLRQYSQKEKLRVRRAWRLGVR
jgi:hypothetical protein